MRMDNFILKIFFSPNNIFTLCFTLLLSVFMIFTGYGNQDRRYSAVYVLWVREASKA